jgi:hypothetical protein
MTIGACVFAQGTALSSRSLSAMKHATFAVLIVLLAACASYNGYNLQPGTSTRDDVVRTMGNPAMEFPDPDGSRRLAYPRGPIGLETFMVDVDRNGVVRNVRQVLTDGVFNGIQPGMTRDEVLRRIGPPGDRMDFPRMNQESFEWRYMDTWRYIAFFSVNFDRSGIVVSKFTRRLDRNDGKQ